jgi:hypothetical protein
MLPSPFWVALLGLQVKCGATCFNDASENGDALWISGVQPDLSHKSQNCSIFLLLEWLLEQVRV